MRMTHVSVKHWFCFLLDAVFDFTERVLPNEPEAAIALQGLDDLEQLFLPQIKNSDEDFIVVCFPDEDSHTSDANNVQLPIQPYNIPLQKSSSRLEQDIKVLCYEAPFNRYCS